jgi:hypothetical protein
MSKKSPSYLASKAARLARRADDPKVQERRRRFEAADQLKRNEAIAAEGRKERMDHATAIAHALEARR